MNNSSNRLIETQRRTILATRLWQARQVATTSVVALAAVAVAAIVAPSVARADNPQCGNIDTLTENPGGAVCDQNGSLQLDGGQQPIDPNNMPPIDPQNISWTNNAYTNNGTFNNNIADGVKYTGAATFTNNGIFNNLAPGALNFSAAGGVFINNGTFNSSTVGSILIGADATITNSGTFNDTASGLGIFDNGGGGNVTFTNTGVYNSSGGAIDLGAAGLFTNSGIFNLGGNATITGNATNMTGNYVQTDTGTLKLRTNWGQGISDSLTVSGDATLAGKVAVNHTNITGGQTVRTFDIVTAGNTLTVNGLSVNSTATITNSVAVNPNDNKILTLTSTINLMGSGGPPLTGNAAAVAQQINALFTSGAPTPFLAALLNIPTTAQYVQALQTLGPVTDASGTRTTLKTSATFANQLLSCRFAGEGDAYAVIREGQCAWTRFTGARTTTQASDVGPGSTENTMMISSGAQFNVGGPWRIGGGIGYEQPTAKSSTWFSETQRMHVGGVIKYNPGPWLFALALNGGWGTSDNTRFVTLPGVSSVIKSSNDSDYISGRFTSAYLVPMGGFYLKPQLEISESWINRGGYTETASAGGALTVQASNLSLWSYSPSIELGSQMRVGESSLLRPYAKVGGTWRDKDSVATTASFADAGAAGGNFMMVSKMDRSFFDLGTGFDLLGKDGAVVRMQYDGQYGETTSSHAGSAKVSVKF